MTPISVRLSAFQPIFDQSEQVFGYELLCREEHPHIDSTAMSALCLLDAQSFYGLTDAKLFVNIGLDALIVQLPMLLDPDRVVIEILETVSGTPFTVEKVQELKDMGYIVALDDYVGDPCHDTLLPLMDIIKIDLSHPVWIGTRGLVERLRGSTDAKLLAEKIENGDRYNVCRNLGFDLYQGFHLGMPSREVLITRPASPLTRCSHGAPACDDCNQDHEADWRTMP